MPDRRPCVARVVEGRARLGDLLAETSPDRPVLVPWQGWALRRDDFLVMRMMEITVHSDDLAASVGITAPTLPDEVLGPVLALLTRLAVRRHGQSAVVAALSRAERAPPRSTRLSAGPLEGIHETVTGRSTGLDGRPTSSTSVASPEHDRGDAHRDDGRPDEAVQGAGLLRGPASRTTRR